MDSNGSEKPTNRPGAWSMAVKSSETPLPAGLASIALLSQAPRALKQPGFRPAKGSVFGFGAAFALGGFIIYDGDLTNGAGFTSAWSMLYLMVNGKASIRQMRPMPLLVTGLVSVNAINYGRKFFFPTHVGQSLA